jgi:hypothetical protein
MGMEEAPDGAPRIDESAVRREVHQRYGDVETPELERRVFVRQSPLKDSGQGACVILLFEGKATEQETDLHRERRLVKGNADGELCVLG